MNKLYSRINWKNYPSEETALNETNLNKIDLGIDNLDNRVIEMDATKVNKEVANSLVQSWSMDEKTGIITITHLDGSKDMFDLNIEKIPVNFELSKDGILTMTTDDGSKFTANIGAMIPVLTFEDSDEIAVSISGEGVNKTYSFSIKSGSVTEDKIQPNFIADVKTEVAKAHASQESAAESASAASGSATIAESYARGGTGSRAGEDTDNAKYYYEKAKNTEIGKVSEEVAGLNNDIGVLSARLDNIASLPEGSTTADAELQDIRVGADGRNYNTAGEAVREQVGEIKGDLDVLNKINTYNSKMNYLDIGSPFQNAIIYDNGDIVEGTGSGNNWVTDYIKIPFDTKIYVMVQTVTYTIALYDKFKNFIKFAIGSSSSTVNPGITIFNVEDLTDVYYIRIGFFDKGGYSIDKFNGTKVWYYLNDISIDDNHIEKTIAWSMSSVGDSKDGSKEIIFSKNTIGTIDFISFDYPLLFECNDNYQIAITAFNDDLTKLYGGNWFNNTKKAIIPPNMKCFLGIRNTNSDDSIRLPLNISDIISIRKIDVNKEQQVTSSIKVDNAIMFSGSLINRIGIVNYRFTNKDLLFHIVNNKSVYTLGYCNSNTLDFNKTWNIYYSNSQDIIIPANSWYIFSVGFADDSSIDGYSLNDLIHFIDLSSINSHKCLSNTINSIDSRLAMLSKRVAVLEDDIVPSYYEEHIANKAQIINALSGAKFAFITDVHFNGYHNTKHSKSLLSYLCENTELNRVFNGGDLFNSGYGLTRNETMKALRESADYTQPYSPCEQFFIIGNHDCGWDYPNGITVEGSIDSADFTVAVGNYLNDVKVVRDINNPTQYYFNDESQKIRYIISNGCCRDVGTNETYTDSWLFVTEALKTTPSGFKIIIFQHIIANSTTELNAYTNDLALTVDNYNNREVSSYGSASANFKNSGGNVIAIIGGHSHADLNFTTPNGVPIITTTTDNAGAETGGLIRTVGTINEQAFDVFTLDTENRRIHVTRVGAGNDREFTY